MKRTVSIMTVLTVGLLAVNLRAADPVAASKSFPEADKAAIRQVITDALKIANTAPLDATAYVKAFYTDQAIVMPANDKAINGSAAIAEWFKSLPPITNLKFDPQEIEGVGDLAYVRGTYSFTIAPPGGDAFSDTGKYLEIWKKQADGSWRVERDIFNSDQPRG
jgi:ketosteroid isomerase-like protein